MQAIGKEKERVDSQWHHNHSVSQELSQMFVIQAIVPRHGCRREQSDAPKDKGYF